MNLMKDEQDFYVIERHTVFIIWKIQHWNVILKKLLAGTFLQKYTR